MPDIKNFPAESSGYYYLPAMISDDWFPRYNFLYIEPASIPAGLVQLQYMIAVPLTLHTIYPDLSELESGAKVVRQVKLTYTFS